MNSKISFILRFVFYYMNSWHTTLSSLVLIGTACFSPLTSFAQSNTPVPSDDFSLTNAPAALQDQSLYQQISPLPQVYVTNLVATADNKNSITGSFVATSGETAAVANIQYELQILQPLPATAAESLVNDDGVVYDRYLFPETFTLSQQESHQVSFTFDAGALPAGSYRTRIQLSQTNDRPLGWGDAAVTLIGERPFVVITTDGVTVESTDPITQEQKSVWEPTEGPNIAAGQTITIKAIASNIGSADITGKPVVDVERILSTERTVLSQEFDAITIPVGEDHALALPLITEAAPGAYRVLLSFHNSEGKRVSGIGEFRYVVTGPSASIVSQLVQELPVYEGDTAMVAFTVAGAADRIQNITGTLEVILSDDQGIIGQVENVLAINGATPAQGTAAIVLQRDRCGVPKVTLVAKNQDGTELDRYEADYPNFTARCNTFLPWSRPLWLALGTIVILILAASYFILRRRNRPVPPNPMSGTIALIIIGIALLGAGIAVSLWGSSNAQANGIQYIAVSSLDPTHQLTRPTLYIASPAHNANVTSNAVYYSARFSWLNCDNQPAKGFLKVYAKADGGQVDWSSGHNWVELAKNTLNLPAQCWRCPTKPAREVALSGTLQVPALAPGGSNTLWSYGDNTGSWIGGSIVQDFTWVNFSPPTSPLTTPAQPTSSPTACLAPNQGFEYDIAVTAGYNNAGAPPAGTGWTVADMVCLISNTSLQCERNAVLWQKVTSQGRNYIVNSCANPGNGYVQKSQTAVAASWSSYAPTFCLWEKTGGTSVDLKLGHAGTAISQEVNCNNPAGTPGVVKPSADYTFSSRACTGGQSVNQPCVSDICLFSKPSANFCPAPTPTTASSPTSLPSVTTTPVPTTTPQCADEVDNDGDSRTDSADPGCHTDRDATNTSSYQPSLNTEADQACSDNKDNDGDGKVDRNDPGCRTSPSDPNTYNPNDNNETDPGVSPGPIQETE